MAEARPGSTQKRSTGSCREEEGEGRGVGGGRQSRDEEEIKWELKKRARMEVAECGSSSRQRREGRETGA